MKIKPHITIRAGMWVVYLAGDPIYFNSTFGDACVSANLVWRWQ